MQITSDLLSIWRRAAGARKISFDFLLPDPIPGIGAAGDRIVCGVKPAPDNGCEFFARNNSTGTFIPDPVIEKAIPGTDFVIQLNRGRSWRPGAGARKLGRQPDISAAWQDCRFDCQVATGPNSRNSLLVREPLFQVGLPHWRWNAYHNAAPFEASGHFLWVPVEQQGISAAMPHFPQKLTREFLADVLVLYRSSANMTLFFNALHAGASVNHIHIQTVTHTQELALEKAIAAGSVTWYGKVGLLEDYPVNVVVFPLELSARDLFPYIHRLQQGPEPIPFNLLMLGESVCIVPRNLDNEVIPELPNGILASMEMAGKIIAPDRAAYDFADADPQALYNVYAKLGLSRSRIAELFELPI